MTNSILDAMFAASEAQRERRILLTVPGLPTDLTCVTIDKVTYQRAQQSAERLYAKKPTLWNWHMCASLISGCTEQIEFNGDRLEDEGGDPITFKATAHFGVENAVDAVRKVCGHDGNVLTLGRALLSESGYDPDTLGIVAEEADPI